MSARVLCRTGPSPDAEWRSVALQPPMMRQQLPVSLGLMHHDVALWIRGVGTGLIIGAFVTDVTSRWAAVAAAGLFLLALSLYSYRRRA